MWPANLNVQSLSALHYSLAVPSKTLIQCTGAVVFSLHEDSRIRPILIPGARPPTFTSST